MPGTQDARSSRCPELKMPGTQDSTTGDSTAMGAGNTGR